MTFPNLTELIELINSISFLLVLLLVCVQMLVILIVPPEKAEKLNYLGKFLEYLVKVRFSGGSNDRKNP